MAVLATPFSVFLIPIVAIIAGCLYMAIDAMSKASTEAAKHRSDNELKMVLAQRGMSAEEIERIVSAKPGKDIVNKDSAEQTVRPGGAVPPNKYQARHSA